MYTVKEFRANLRQALNDAREGHEVIIERWGEKFQLVSLVDKPLGGQSFESKPKETPSLKPIRVPNKIGYPIDPQAQAEMDVAQIERLKPVTYKRTSNWGA